MDIFFLSFCISSFYSFSLFSDFLNSIFGVITKIFSGVGVLFVRSLSRKCFKHTRAFLEGDQSLFVFSSCRLMRSFQLCLSSGFFLAVGTGNKLKEKKTQIRSLAINNKLNKYILL